MESRATVLLAIGALCATGCRSWTVQGPPRTTAGAPARIVPVSSIAMPVSVETDALRSSLEADLKSGHLVKDRTPDLGLRLLVSEQTMIQRPRKLIDVAYRAAYCQVDRVPKQITEHVKVGTEMVKCALSPWKWGSCAKDVFKDVTRTVLEDVTRCFPEQLEVAHTVMEPVIQLQEAIAPTTVALRYQADLNGLGMSVRGNRIEVSPATRVQLDLDLRQGILGANVAVRGAVQCVSDVTPTVKAEFALAQEGAAIRPHVKVRDLQLDWQRICVPGAVEALDAAQVLAPLTGVISDQIGKAIEGRLRGMLADRVTEATGEIDIAAQLRGAAQVVRQPVRLAPDVWLVPHASRLLVSQLEGQFIDGRERLVVTAALEASPEVRYGERPPSDTGHLEIALGAAGDRFRVEPEGVLPLATVGQKLDSLLRAVVAVKKPKYKDVRTSVDVYQSGERIVFGVSLSGIPPFRSSGVLYLSGVPAFDPATRAIRLEHVGFDVATREFLVHKAAWLLDGAIEKYLETALHFGVGTQLDRTLAQLATFADTTPSGVLAGRLERLQLGQIWVADSSLHLTVRAEGTSGFTPTIPPVHAADAALRRVEEHHE